MSEDIYSCFNKVDLNIYIIDNCRRPKRYCGRKAKENIISTGSKVRIHFHSDETGKERGFRLTVKRLLDEGMF